MSLFLRLRISDREMVLAAAIDARRRVQFLGLATVSVTQRESLQTRLG